MKQKAKSIRSVYRMTASFEYKWSSESNCKLSRWVKITLLINHCPDYQNTNFTREIHTRNLNNFDGNTNIMFIQVRCTVWFT